MVALRHFEDKEKFPPTRQANTITTDKALLAMIKRMQKQVDSLGTKLNQRTPAANKGGLVYINYNTGKSYR